MEKCLTIFGVQHHHSHGHSHGAKKSKKKKSKKEEHADLIAHKQKQSGILNLIADASHNFTDGLAIAASFRASFEVGLSTSLAVLIHEIPHEIGDFGILLQSGFSINKAIQAQLITACGALMGCFFGLLLADLNDSTTWILPITAGGFIYIALVNVIPSLMEETNVKQSIYETIAMLIGVAFMVLISLFE